jgi:hypothetical protein
MYTVKLVLQIVFDFVKGEVFGNYELFLFLYKEEPGDIGTNFRIV